MLAAFQSVIAACIVGQILGVGSIYPTEHRQQPEFQRDSNRTSNFLASDEVWVPGTTTLVTMRMVGEPLDIAVRLLNGPASFGQPKLYLMVKCSQSDSFVTAELFTGFTEPISATGENNNKLGRVFCKHRQPFSVQPVQSRSNQFRLKLIDNAGRVPFEESLDLSAEIAVRAAYNRLELTSSSLLIYNWDSLLSFDDEADDQSFSGGSAPKNQHQILSKEAIDYLSFHFDYLHGSKFKKVPFLHDRFAKMVQKSSLVVRSSLVFSVIVRYNSSSCWDVWAPRSDIVVSSGDPDFGSNSTYIQSNLKPCYYLDLRTGVLEVNGHCMNGRVDKAARLIKNDTQVVLTCYRISASNKAWRYNALKPVKVNYMDLRSFLVDIRSGLFLEVFNNFESYKRFVKKCHTSFDKIEVQLFSGMIDVILQVPVVCSIIQRVFHNGTVCAGQVGGDGFRNCSQYSVSKFYSAIRFDGMLSTKHAGVYTFATEDTVFKFIVTVISLPLFRTDAQSGDLQAESMVTELVQLFNLSCTAFYSSVSPVSLRPSFLVNVDFNLVKMAVHEFTQYLGTAPQKLEVKRSDDNNSSSRLQLYMPYVENPGDKANAFVVRCRASLTAAVTKKLLGTSVEYSTETRGIVRFTNQVRNFRNYMMSKDVSSAVHIDIALLTTSMCFSIVVSSLTVIDMG
ncbi:hypothetical protein BOX15_Mlig008635g1 [Macrostomum lignano]|uniref:Uncharacterized protein n=1 Tax=Macrostomum lignano TaxID=282301 RepID=A0A267H342_9PLAT|nr:hypothetical protein BOX15_Mlig008635g1 [Macrostomum lignano]